MNFRPGRLILQDFGTLVAAITAMTFSEATIIYLSLGAPVAMYSFIKSGSTNPFRTILHLFVWPIALVRLLNSNAAALYADADGHRQPESHHVAGLVEEMIESARSELSPADTVAMTEVKELVPRYAGLHTALKARGTGSAELYEAAGHSNIGLALRCSSRRAHRILWAHRDAACTEFVRMMNQFDERHPRTVESARRLVDAIGDTEAAEAISRHADVLSDPYTANGLTGRTARAA